MLVQDFETAPRRGASAHRGGGVAFVSLLTGSEGAPDNFDLMIVDMENDYKTPRHRHNFDQVRIMLQGYFEWAPGTPQPEGSVGYFSEGTYYTQQGIGPSRTLVLQVGGASGAGYISYRQLQAAILELQAVGEFRDGVYRPAGTDGKVEQRDGYQAAWEHVRSAKLAYAEPRYQMPIIAFPDAFAWRTHVDGSSNRLLGTFNERGLSVSQISVKADSSSKLIASPQTRLLYVVAGHGTCDGRPYSVAGGIRIDGGEDVTVEAGSDSLFYVFALPVFD